jgi:hypothetical protein
MESWTPNPEGLENILNILRNAQSPDHEIQRSIQQVFKIRFQLLPSYSNSN